MKPAAAFAAGLWTGAVAAAAVGVVFYLRLWDVGGRETAAVDRGKLLERIELLQQEQARAQAEEARLRQTITDLQTRAAIEMRRQMRVARREAIAQAEAPRPEPWMIEAVAYGDVGALPRIEKAALEGNLVALDALALLADQENTETLTRVWSSGKLGLLAQRRATLLLAATVELNPRAEELLQGLFYAPADPSLREAALAGILMPDFPTRLQVSEDFPAPPHFLPDYAMRLRLVEGWRAAVTNEQTLAQIDRIRAQLAQQASAGP